MSLVPSFTVLQTIGLPSIINISDNSTGSDGTITDRKVYLIDVDGNYITAAGSYTVPTATDWIYANTSVAIDCLHLDMALQIRVDWLNAGGTIVYTKTTLFAFTLYGLQGSFALTQSLSGQPDTIADQNYWTDRMNLRCCIDDANNAVAIGNNQFVAQAALNRESYYLANLNLFF